MLAAIINALSGRLRWIKAKRKYNIDNSGMYVIMLPDSDREFNEAALTHIDNFLDYRKGNGVVILTIDEWVTENANSFSSRIKAVERITQRDYYYYHCYYYYYGFSERFIMMSLQGDYGKRLVLAENVRGITKEDMVCLGLYVIRTWQKSEVDVHG